MHVDVGTHGWMWTREWRGCLFLLYRESASAQDKGLAEPDMSNHLLGTMCLASKMTQWVKAPTTDHLRSIPRVQTPTSCSLTSYECLSTHLDTHTHTHTYTHIHTKCLCIHMDTHTLNT